MRRGEGGEGKEERGRKRGEGGEGMEKRGVRRLIGEVSVLARRRG